MIGLKKKSKSVKKKIKNSKTVKLQIYINLFTHSNIELTCTEITYKTTITCF